MIIFASSLTIMTFAVGTTALNILSLNYITKSLLTASLVTKSDKYIKRKLNTFHGPIPENITEIFLRIYMDISLY